MPTPSRASTTKSAKSTTVATRKTKEPNVIDLLIADHKKVKALFKEFEKLAKKEDKAGKVKIAKQICQELKVHTQVEEEIFYPAAQECLKSPDLIDEANVEHATAKDLIKQILAMKGSEHLYDAKVKVLSEYIDHHVKEEETEIFPQARKAKMNLEELGLATAERKAELLSRLPH